MARKIKKKNQRNHIERNDPADEKEIVRRLCRTINQAKTDEKTIASIIADFLWSIGSSLEQMANTREFFYGTSYIDS